MGLLFSFSRSKQQTQRPLSLQWLVYFLPHPGKSEMVCVMVGGEGAFMSILWVYWAHHEGMAAGVPCACPANLYFLNKKPLVKNCIWCWESPIIYIHVNALGFLDFMVDCLTAYTSADGLATVLFPSSRSCDWGRQWEHWDQREERSLGTQSVGGSSPGALNSKVKLMGTCARQGIWRVENICSF